MLGMNLLYQLPYFGSQVEEAFANWYYGERRKADDVVNPINSISRKIEKLAEKETFFERRVQPIAELILGTQLDPVIALYNAIEDGIFGKFDEKEYYENIYDLLGVTPSYRPKKKGEYEGKIPQGGINTKSDLKRYDPELYEKIYGKRDELMKQKREERKKALERRGYKEVGGKLYKID